MLKEEGRERETGSGLQSEETTERRGNADGSTAIGADADGGHPRRYQRC